MKNKNLKLTLLFSVGTVAGLFLLINEIFDKPENQNAVSTGGHIGDLIAYSYMTIFVGCAAVYHWIKHKKLSDDKNLNSLDENAEGIYL